MYDPVEHPKHYNTGVIETADYIRDKLNDDEWRGYIKGNVLKYVSRERHKGGLEDMRKAAWYLNKYIELEQMNATASTVEKRTTSSTKRTGRSGMDAKSRLLQEKKYKSKNKKTMTEQRG